MDLLQAIVRHCRHRTLDCLYIGQFFKGPSPIYFIGLFENGRLDKVGLLEKLRAHVCLLQTINGFMKSISIKLDQSKIRIKFS